MSLRLSAAHRTDRIVAGMTERYITSIAQRLPAAVTSYSDFVLINTQKVGRRAPCGEIRGKRGFVIFKAHLGNALALLRTKKIHFALVLLVGQFVYIYKSVSAITLRVSSTVFNNNFGRYLDYLPLPSSSRKVSDNALRQKVLL